MSKLITNFDEGEMDLFKKQYISLPELAEKIEALKDDKPKKKGIADWKDKLNFLIDMYNAKAKFKSYNRIK